MNISQLCLELDKRVEVLYKTKEHQSTFVEPSKVLYFKPNGQLLIEFEIEGVYQDVFGGSHISVKEFDYSNKLSAQIEGE